MALGPVVYVGRTAPSQGAEEGPTPSRVIRRTQQKPFLVAKRFRHLIFTQTFAGSNPVQHNASSIWPYSLMVATTGFHPVDRSSILLRVIWHIQQILFKDCYCSEE